MFEHVQQRNRRPTLVPILAGVGICVAVYFVVDRWSRRTSERESMDFMNSFAGSIKNDAPLERAQLPGMSIELPGRPTERGDYVAGVAEVAGASVSWVPGLLDDDAWFMQQQFKLFGAGEKPLATTQFGGAFAFEDHVGEELHVLAGSCGRRTIIVRATTNRERFDQIKASFRCRPDRELLHLGAIVGPRKGWKRMTDDPKILLTDSIGDVRLILQSRRDSYDPRGKQSIPADATPEAVGRYRIWRGHGTSLKGQPLVTALVDWQCPDHPYFGEAFITSPTSVDEAIQVALTGSCIAMTAPLPEHLQP